MCGRYASARKRQELLEEFDIGLDGTPEELGPDYNVAPTKKVYAVLTRPVEQAGEGEADSGGTPEPARQLRVLKWGFVPSWAKDPSIGSRMINARVETLAEKPAFRRAFARRRCLLPADGYYEWFRADKKTKQPYFIHPEGGGVMAMAGLYEFWKDPTRADDDPLKWLTTCTVITTTAEDHLGHIHDRMPVIIGRDRWADWLDPERTDPGQLLDWLKASPPSGLAAYPVSSEVNNVRNNGPHLMEPESPEAALF
ncbi:SOS response-associated peptidase [Sphaerisporangium perillae]|uniref:SOS response-associated peptidase n=1 Tax=Sphaerisporangium perillae TaxID=2935860 RepID=UPI00200EF853|nr:SOS response-associated peptidase [Sphaerisporangium perillae]